MKGPRTGWDFRYEPSAGWYRLDQPEGAAKKDKNIIIKYTNNLIKK